MMNHNGLNTIVERSGSPAVAKVPTKSALQPTRRVNPPPPISQKMNGGASQTPNRSMEDHIRNESVIIAEVKTNVHVENEYQIIAELSRILSARYNRSISYITVILQHSLCMLFRGSVKPAYTLTINALPHLIRGPANRRNILLIQNHLTGLLQIAPERGYIQFVATPEDCCGSDGNTVAGQMGEVVRPANSASVPYRKHNRKSKSISFDLNKTHHQIARTGNPLRAPTHASAHASQTSLQSPDTEPKTVPWPGSVHYDGKSKETNGQEEEKLNKRKSFIHSLFHRNVEVQSTRQ